LDRILVRGKLPRRALVGDAKEHQIMADADWGDIEELRHRLWLQQHEAVSEEFVTQTQKLIAERVQDKNAVEALRGLI
jgi:hypothetical protein